MTHDEMIAVIQAHKEGKTIQSKLKDKTYNDDWDDCSDICWDFSEVDYRIKPESHYRPFKSAEEVLEAIKEHGDILSSEYNSERVYFPLMFMINKKNTLEVFDFYEKHWVEINIVADYTFTDGTPFGVKEE